MGPPTSDPPNRIVLIFQGRQLAALSPTPCSSLSPFPCSFPNSQHKRGPLPFQAPLILSPLVTQLCPELSHLALESPAAANMSLRGAAWVIGLTAATAHTCLIQAVAQVRGPVALTAAGERRGLESPLSV